MRDAISQPNDRVKVRPGKERDVRRCLFWVRVGHRVLNESMSLVPSGLSRIATHLGIDWDIFSGYKHWYKDRDEAKQANFSPKQVALCRIGGLQRVSGEWPKVTIDIS